MSALAHEAVGAYMNRQFVATYVKVGAFALVNGQKQGGNVASYFCMPDGRVLHLIAGPVDANIFLSEAKWAVANHQFAAFEGQQDLARFKEAFSTAHAQRLHDAQARGLVKQLNRLAVATDPESGDFGRANDPLTAQKMRVLNEQMLPVEKRVHLLLALFPLAKVQDIYKYVFEMFLNEKVSTLPVLEQ